MAPALEVLRGAFAGVAPRERRLLMLLGAVLALLAIVGVYFWSSSALDDLETERAAAVDALRTIRNERTHIRQRQTARERMLARFATRAPALTSFVEQASHDPASAGAGTSPQLVPGAGPSPHPPAAAAEIAATAGAADAGTGDAAPPNGVTVAEATDRSSPAAAGAHFQRRAVAIRLRRVNLQNLVGFMDRVDAAPFPAAITSLRMRRVFGESNTYDIDDMVIATWDRVATAPASHRTAQPAASPAAAPSTTDDLPVRGRR